MTLIDSISYLARIWTILCEKISVTSFPRTEDSFLTSISFVTIEVEIVRAGRRPHMRIALDSFNP